MKSFVNMVLSIEPESSEDIRPAARPDSAAVHPHSKKVLSMSMMMCLLLYPLYFKLKNLKREHTKERTLYV